MENPEILPVCTIEPLALYGCEWRRYTGFAQPFPTHSHDHYVIGIVRNGRRHLLCNGEEHDLAAGDVVVFNPGDAHGCVQGDGVLFAFDSIVLSKAALDGAVLPGPVLRGSWVRVAFEELAHAVQAVSDEKGIKAVVLSFSITLSKAAKGVSEAVVYGRNHSAAMRTYGHLRGHVANPDPLGELAKREQLSEYALIRAYKRAFFITPSQHLLSLRVGLARDLLAGGMSPADAAAQAGFSDQAHLTRAFKQRIGSTPAAYRSMVQGGAPQ